MGEPTAVSTSDTSSPSATRRARGRNALAVLLAIVVVVPAAAVAAKAALPGSTKPQVLSSTRSLQVLRTAFGAVAERPIREGKIVVAPTSAAILSLSDKVNMANRAHNPRTGRVWALGDSAAAWPNGIRGFTDVVTGDVYINAQEAIETTTPHEMLHANSSSDFLDTMGLALYEGLTEQLALDALAVSGIAPPKVPEYADERRLVAAVINVTGRDRLVRAYLNGGSALEDLVSTVGAQTVTRMKSASAVGNIGQALQALEGAKQLQP